MEDVKEIVAIRDSKGKFLKGSVASAGRPKKVDVQKLIEDSKLSKEFYEDLKDIKDTSARVEYIINYLLKNAITKDEVFKYTKEFADFYKSKLKNVETTVKEDRHITFSWASDKKISKEQEMKVIEGEVTKEIQE